MSRRSLQQRAVASMGARRRAAAPAAARVMARQRAQFRAAANSASLRQARMRIVPTAGRENKFYDPVTADGTKQIVCTTTGAVSNSTGNYVFDGVAGAPGAIVLNQIPQGTTQSTRLGRKARMTGLRIKGFFLATTAATINTTVSLSVIHQTAPNNPSSMPTYNTIWVAQHDRALRAVNDIDKLKIIRSIGAKLIGDADTAPTDHCLVEVDEFIDLKPFNVITEWTQADTTGVYGNMEKGALLLYGLGAASSANNFYGSFRVYFDDY